MLWTAGSPDDEGRVLVDPNALSDAGHDDAVGDRGQRRRRARRAARSATPAPTGARGRVRNVGHRRGAARPDPVEQVHARGVDARRRRLLLRPLPGAAGRCGLRRPEPRHGAALPPARHRSGGRRRRVLDARTSRSGCFEPEVSDDGRLLVVTIWRGTDPETRIYVADLADGVERAIVRPLLDAADAHYEHVATIDRRVYPPDQPRRAARPRHRRRRRRSRRGSTSSSRRPTTRSSTSCWSGTGSPASTSTTPTTGWRSSSSTGRFVMDVALPGIGIDRRARRPTRGPGAVPDVRDLPRAVDRARGAHGRRRGPRGRRPRPGVGPGRLRHASRSS